MDPRSWRRKASKIEGIGLLAIVLSLFTSGCGTLSNGRGWGQDAIYPVDLKRVGRAAHNAFFDLETLIPALGAAIFAIDDFDEDVSDWASENTPIFGSKEAAEDASDYLRYTLLAEAVVTALATPSNGDSKDWAYYKLKGLAVEGVAMGITEGTTSLLKEVTDRTRPDGSDHQSFPSSHASGAFSSSTLANRNLDYIRMPWYLRRPIQIANIGLAASTAWARVEGEKHFPSDVLAGAALGHFLSAFIHDAFLNLPEQEVFGLVICPRRGGAMAQLSFSF
jgi:membrane-associated phospholipid phosphatase